MRIKLIVLIMVLASLACTANVSILSPTLTHSPESIPTPVTQTPPPVTWMPQIK
jgi:hypothetical protein